MVVEQSRNVHRITIDCTKEREHWFLLSSDHHWDNPDSNQEMIKRHLQEAKEKNAHVFIVGDFFCAMQGKYDRRASKDKLRPEHQKANYLDSLVDTAANWLEPYKEQIAIIGLGNHETAILKNHETNLIERLVERLNINNKNKVYAGGYGGYIRLNFQRGGSSRLPLNIKYFHGYGGGGPVTKGVIQSYRQSQFYPDADIVISGHVHEQYLMSYMQERLKDDGSIKLKEQWHVRMPTYKDEYKDGHSGWHVENGRPPKPLGAWWLKVNYHRIQKNNKTSFKLTYDFIKAN